MNANLKALFKKWLNLLLFFTIGGAVGGYLFGMGQPVVAPWTPAPRAPPTVATTNILPAVAYLDMDSRTRGPNRDYRSDLATLASRIRPLTNEVINLEADRVRSLALRTVRRAYDGAPPVVPHPVNDNDVASCAACHGEGREIAGRIAPRMSHRMYVNCTQCHAPAGNPGLGPAFPVDNTFAGLGPPGRGARAWDGAPPVIPHRTHMRENCIACHGLLGREGMRSTHPWRVNCIQCHAGSAAEDGYLFTVEGEIGKPALPSPAPAPNT